MGSILGASPVPVKFSFRSAPTAAEALELAYSSLAMGLNPWADDDGEPVLAAHYDLNSYMATLRSRGIGAAKKRVYQMIRHVMRIELAVKGIGAYLGGDNVIVFSHTGSLDQVLGSVPRGAKVGIGIGRVPRDAVKRASMALARIRMKRDRNSLVIRDD